MRELSLLETQLLSGGTDHQCDDHDHDHDHADYKQTEQKRSYDFDFSNWF